MMKRIIFIALSLIGFFCSCNYQFDKSFIDLQPPIAEELHLDLFSENDTLYIRSYSYLNFGYFADAEIVDFNLFIDDNRISTSAGYYNGYWLSPKDYSTGYHSLKLELYEKTNSGSLADKMNSEAFVHEFKKVLLIDNEKLEPLKIESTEINEEGELVIKWKKYEGYKFDHYLINYRNHDYIIHDVDKNYLVLPGYCGGEARVKMSISAKETVLVNNEIFKFDFDFKIDKVNDDELHVSWKKSPFAATKGFVLAIYDEFIYDPFEGNNQTINFSNGTENIDEKISYSTTFPYSLKVRLYATDENGSFWQVNDNFAVVPLISPHISMRGPKWLEIAGDVFYTHSHRNISKYLLKTQERIAEIDNLELGMSPNKQFIYGAKMTDVYTLFIYEYDKETLNKTSEIKLKFSNINYNVNKIIVSDDKYLFIGYGNSNYIVYHWPSKQIIYDGYYRSTTVHEPFLGNGGNYYYEGYRYTEFSNGFYSWYSRYNDIGDCIYIPGKNIALTVDNSRRKVFSYDIIAKRMKEEYLIDRNMLKLYSNNLNHWGVLRLTSEEEYIFEVYSLTNGIDKITEINLPNKVVPENLKDIKFHGNTLFISNDDYNNPKIFFKHLDFIPG